MLPGSQFAAILSIRSSTIATAINASRPLRAVPLCAGTIEAAALSLTSRAASSPLGRVQLKNLG